jgi:hypothetical protein
LSGVVPSSRHLQQQQQRHPLSVSPWYTSASSSSYRFGIVIIVIIIIGAVVVGVGVRLFRSDHPRPVADDLPRGGDERDPAGGTISDVPDPTVPYDDDAVDPVVLF